ncbi:MAG: DegT/DnrJ/EryC1/StrS family aminotransferase, partial [Paludibacter sp.]|nr:DegT/DnrJ/EryC1/StrS family aminotransferase [Paludibacter sp.]
IKMRAIANHGMEVRYHHDYVGVNSRLDSIQAAILDVKLKYLDNYIRARQVVAAEYDKAFSNVEQLIIPGRNLSSTHVFHQYTLKLNGVDRAGLQTHLQARGIPSMVYYPVPLHMQKAYKDKRYQEGDLPVAEKLAACVLSLPIHTEMSEKQIQYIIENLIDYL